MLACGLLNYPSSLCIHVAGLTYCIMPPKPPTFKSLKSGCHLTNAIVSTNILAETVTCFTCCVKLNTHNLPRTTSHREGFHNTGLLPGKMYGLLTSHTEVKAGGVLHLIRVSRFLYPVANWVAVHSIYHVPLIIWTAPVMAWTATWWQRRQPLRKLVTKYPCKDVFLLFFWYTEFKRLLSKTNKEVADISLRGIKTGKQLWRGRETVSVTNNNKWSVSLYIS